MKNENIVNKEIIVIGGVHHNTLGVIRSLGKAGVSKKYIFLILVGRNIRENDFVSKSKYVDRHNVAYLESELYLHCFLKEKAKDSQQRVIICCSDGAAEYILNDSKNLNNYICPSIDAKFLSLFNKQRQTIYASNFGFNVPQSKVISTTDEISWGNFPCIIKPIKSVKGAGKDDIRIAQNKEELVKQLGNVVSRNVQIQDYINKEMEFQLIGCSLDGGNIVIIPGYTRILRQAANTNTGYLKYSSIDNLNIDTNKVKDFFKSIGYSGLFSMEFIRDKDGKDYYLETNFRNDGNAYCVTSAGVNLPYIWVYYCLRRDLPQLFTTCVDSPVTFIPDLEDLKIGIKNDGFISWIKEFIRAESHSVFSVSDIMPFINQVYFRILKKRLKNNK